MSLLGIDLGTSGVRSVAFDPDGRELASAARRVEILRPGPQRAELAPEAVWTAVCETVSEVTRAVPDVGAVSFAVLGEAVVPVDDAQNPVDNAPLSMDKRGLEAAGRFVAAEEFQQLTGQPLHPMFAVFKIMASDWRAVKYLSMGDFIAARLGAEPVTDLTLAARTGLYDVERREWAATLLDAAGVAESQLPRVAAPGTQIGRVSAKGAAATGLREGTPIATGIHDQAAAFLGAGGRAGQVSDFALGSSDCLTVATPARPQGLLGTGIATYPISDQLWLTLCGTAAGGWAIEWLASILRMKGARLTEVLNHPAEDPPALLVLPYLAGSGTLDNEPLARGVVAGLTLQTTPAELVRAFLEAPGYELAKIASALAQKGIPLGRINAVGAGVSDTTLGIRASAAGMPLTEVHGHVTARGAALLAGLATGVHASFESLPPPQAGCTHYPESQEWYARQRVAYVDLYNTTLHLNKALARKE